MRRTTSESELRRGREKATFWWKSFKERDKLAQLGIDEKMTLKWNQTDSVA
jgi:hypothetical protein